MTNTLWVVQQKRGSLIKASVWIRAYCTFGTPIASDYSSWRKAIVKFCATKKEEVEGQNHTVIRKHLFNLKSLKGSLKVALKNALKQRIKLQIFTLQFCAVMFSWAVPYDVTSGSNLCNSSFLIFGFTFHKKYALMHLQEQLRTFYNDLCV